MKNRIRSAAIILDKDNRLLLLKNRNGQTGQLYFIPPGGGFYNDEDVFMNAKRETKEECGLDIETDRIIYLREYFYTLHNSYNLEVYILAKNYSGEISHSHQLADTCIEDICWFTQAELVNKTVYPEVLKDEFWKDLKNNFPTIKYLGKVKD